MVFFDFKAAFPSVAHDFLWEVLKGLGLPPAWITMIQHFYKDNRQFVGEGDNHSFLAEVGIRQGCPLSPLIFAVVADLLLRRLEDTLQGRGEVKAFADDTAVILKNIEVLEVLMDEFGIYAGFFNLHLNLSKTVVIPLFFPGELQRATAWIEAHVPSSRGMKIEDRATYLGIELGPGAGRAGWEAPTRKFRERSFLWKDKGMGIFYSIRAYKIFCVSILQFYLQFYGCDRGQKDAECRALLDIFKGPGNWILPKDIWALHAQMGFPMEIPSIAILSLASKLRMYITEPFLRQTDWHREISYLLNQWGEDDMRLEELTHPWKEWLTEGVVSQVYLAKYYLQEKLGITTERTLARCRELHPHVEGPLLHRYLQKVICNMCWAKEPSILPRVREKMARWKLNGVEGEDFLADRVLADRFLKNITFIFRELCPRVGASYFSILWNRCTTSRRFQRAGCCVLCRNPSSWDSVEHYAFCPVVSEIGVKLFRLPPALNGLRARDQRRAFFCLKREPSPEDLMIMALFLHVIYCLQNEHRRVGERVAHIHLIDFCKALMVKAARGSPKPQRLVAALLGPPGPLPRIWRQDSLPPAKRRFVLPPVAG